MDNERKYVYSGECASSGSSRSMKLYETLRGHRAFIWDAYEMKDGTFKCYPKRRLPWDVGDRIKREPFTISIDDIVFESEIG